ncbi:UNVERIFIED_CONTAM: hypothetical protein HDU68_006635, partial [Siphonaria sp. JEL0065]
MTQPNSKRQKLVSATTATLDGKAQVPFPGSPGNTDESFWSWSPLSHTPNQLHSKMQTSAHSTPNPHSLVVSTPQIVDSDGDSDMTAE